jgi:hypothetical protein
MPELTYSSSQCLWIRLLYTPRQSNTSSTQICHPPKMRSTNGIRYNLHFSNMQYSSGTYDRMGNIRKLSKGLKLCLYYYSLLLMKHSALGWCFSYISHYIHVAPAAELVYAIRHPKMRVVWWSCIFFLIFLQYFHYLAPCSLQGIKP